MDENKTREGNGFNGETNIGNDIDGDVPNGFEKDIPVNNGMSDEEKQEARENKFRRVAGLGFTAGVILGATGGISEVDAQKLAEKRNSIDSNPPLRQQYDNTQQQYEDENTAKVEFLDSSIGSGLDSEGFHKETYSVERPIEFESIDKFAEIIPNMETLKGYKFVKEEKLDSYQDTKIISDYFNIYSFPLEKDLFPGDTFSVSTVELEKVIDYIVEPQNLPSFPINKDLKGLGFSVSNIITLKGPQGDQIKLGEYPGLFGYYTKTYLLLAYIDKEGKNYSFASDNFSDEDKGNYGKSQDSFLAVSHILYDEIARGAEHDNGIISKRYQMDQSLKTGFLNEIYDVQELRDLQEISEENKAVKVILGLTHAINSYPGDEIVTTEYLENMFEYNKGTYGFESREIDNKQVYPEKMTKYLLNYIDEDGNNWYENYLDLYDDCQSWYNAHFESAKHPKGYKTFYANETQIIRDLNLLSASVEGKNVQPFALSNLYRNLIGLPAVKISSVPVGSLRELIPSTIAQYDGGYFHSDVLRDAYISPHFLDFDKLKIGDSLVAREIGPILSDTGEHVGHIVTVFFEEPTENGSRKWVFDVDADGVVRLYPWDNNGRRIHNIGPLSSPYGIFDLLRDEENLPPEIKSKQLNW